MTWLDAVNFYLQEVADELAQEVVDAQYHDMVQEIMAGDPRYTEELVVACEFDS